MLVRGFPTRAARRSYQGSERTSARGLLYGKQFDRLAAVAIEGNAALPPEERPPVNSPKAWLPGTPIQISLDASFVARGKPKIDSDLDALLPRWLEPNRLPPGSRGPLVGITEPRRAAGERDSSRPYRVHKPDWLLRLHRLGRQQAEHRRSCHKRCRSGRSFRRLERTLALCEFIQHGQEGSRIMSATWPAE